MIPEVARQLPWLWELARGRPYVGNTHCPDLHCSDCPRCPDLNLTGVCGEPRDGGLILVFGGLAFSGFWAGVVIGLLGGYVIFNRDAARGTPVAARRRGGGFVAEPAAR